MSTSPLTSNTARDQEEFLPPLPAVQIDVASIGIWADLQSGLKALGFSVYLAGERVTQEVVTLVVDDTHPEIDGCNAFVVVARESSIEAARAAVRAGASGFFAAPFDFPSLGAGICVAAAQARQFTELIERSARVHESSAANEAVSTVVGMLMERFRLRRAEAYGSLRRYSRAERRKVAEVAAEIVTAAEELSRTMHGIVEPGPKVS